MALKVKTWDCSWPVSSEASHGRQEAQVERKANLSMWKSGRMTSNSFASLGKQSFIHLSLEHLDIYCAPGAGLRTNPLACGRASESGRALGMALWALSEHGGPKRGSARHHFLCLQDSY